MEAPGFNIADPKLNLRLIRSKKLAYHVVGNENVTPFFMTHQIKYNRRKDTFSLIPYGKF